MATRPTSPSMSASRRRGSPQPTAPSGGEDDHDEPLLGSAAADAPGGEGKGVATTELLAAGPSRQHRQSFFGGGLLSASSRKLLGRLKTAQSAGVRVFEDSMRENLHVPLRSKGLVFLGGLLLYVLFVGLLTYIVVDDRNSFAMRAAYSTILDATNPTGYTTVDTREELKQFLASLPGSSWAQEYIGLGAGRRIGAILVTQQRTYQRPCERIPDAVTRAIGSATPDSCVTDVSTDTLVRSPYPSRTFPGIVYPFSPGSTLCLGAVCAESIRSVVRSDSILYENDAGNRIVFYNGTWWLPTAAGATPMVIANDSTVAMVDWNASATEAFPAGAGPNVLPDRAVFPRQGYFGTLDLFDDFLDENSRVVLVEMAVVNLAEATLSSAYLMFELPISGGVFPYLTVSSVRLDLSSKSISINGFLIAYAVIYLLSLAVLLARAIKKTHDGCFVCRGTYKREILVFNCVKCRFPTELTTEVVACSQCETPIPSLQHVCWRVVMYDVWNLLVVACLVILLVSAYIKLESIPWLRDQLRAVCRDIESGNVPSQSVRQGVGLAVWSMHLITASVVLAYVKLFRYACRGRTNAGFVNAFLFGLPALMAFNVNFLVTFMGFVLAFHLIQGSSTMGYSTVSKSTMMSFRSLLGVINTEELGPRTGAFLLLYVVFYLICACLMFNVFPSVLNVAYKRARKTPYYDTDALSLWLIVKPSLRRLGFLAEGGKQQSLKAEDVQRAQAETALDGEVEMQTVAGGKPRSDTDSLPPKAPHGHRPSPAGGPRERAEHHAKQMEQIEERMRAMNVAFRTMFVELSVQVGALGDQVERLTEALPSLIDERGPRHDGSGLGSATPATTSRNAGSGHLLVLPAAADDADPRRAAVLQPMLTTAATAGELVPMESLGEVDFTGARGFDPPSALSSAVDSAPRADADVTRPPSMSPQDRLLLETTIVRPAPGARPSSGFRSRRGWPQLSVADTTEELSADLLSLAPGPTDI